MREGFDPEGQARRWLILHGTHPRWEAGEPPGAELIARVGALLGELGREGRLLGAEGLRATSLGVRLRFEGGQRTLIRGPFPGEHELPAGFEIIRVATLNEATEWATRLAALLGDVEVDVRPVTEPWDIGLSERTPGVPGTRFMLLHKATPRSEAGGPTPARERTALTQLRREMSRAGVLLTNESLRPSTEGRRLRFREGAAQVLDGPFAESKELIAGYILIRADSLAEATLWADRYGVAVESRNVDIRAVEEPEPAGPGSQP